MKKIISIFLVFMISFSAFTIHKQKETNALAIAGGYLGISAILKILAGGALLAGTGYVVGDLVHKPEDNSDFTDFLKEVYKASFEWEPQQQPPPPEPLDPMDQAALLSLLTNQGIEVGTDLYQYINDYYDNQGEENNIPDFGNDYTSVNVAGTTVLGNYLSDIQSLPLGTTWNYKLYYQNQLFGYFTEELVENTPGWISVFPKAIQNTFVTINNNKSTWLSYNYNSRGHSLKNVGMQGNSLSYSVHSNNDSLVFQGLVDLLNHYEPEPTLIPDVITPPEEPLPDVVNWNPTFQQFDMTPLNGLVSNAQEMIDIVTGAKQVTPQRYKEINEAWNEVLRRYYENPNFQGLPDEPVEPDIDPITGNMVFNDVPDGPITDPESMPDDLTALERIIYWLKGIWYAILDIPTGIINGLNKLYNLLSTWLNQFWIKIQEIIDDFWMSFSDWWQDNFIYHWTTFQNWIQNIWQGIPDLLNNIWEWLQGLPVLDISNLLNNIWEWIQGLPDLIYSWFIPEPELIQNTWQPVIDLWNNKLDPVLAPFQNLAFYEEELQDVSVNLKFGSYQGTHKIIDYQYVKSVKDSVKSIIRAFFWILIIFFNLDQVHRLIRNQSIINAYVRKIDPPKGRD